MDEKNFGRRSFFRMALTAAVVAPLALRSIGNSEAATAACPSTAPAGKQVADVGVGMAKSLEYVTDSSTSKNAKHKAGQNCGNCKYYNEKKAEGGYAPCTMMGMKYVTSCGWCKSYLVKA
jgi:hypothetical protein